MPGGKQRKINKNMKLLAEWAFFAGLVTGLALGGSLDTVRRTEFGEGNYDRVEEAFQTLLKAAGNSVSRGLVVNQTPGGNISPETYLGSNRAEYYYPGGSIGPGIKHWF